MLEKALQSFLQSALARHEVSRLVLGFSAGLDSTALLQALVSWRLATAQPVELLAVHVHHGLSQNADAWANQALATAHRLGVRCDVLHVNVGQGASVEAEARKARYAAFDQVLMPGDALVLAQHQDDQAETLLFRLVRGAGVHGLGAMQAETMLKTGVPLWRPLLGVSRSELADYATVQGLSWVSDESNADTRYARNFLRQHIIPALRTQWPEVSRTLAATAHRMQEADSLLGEYARLLLDPIRLSEKAVSVGGLLALGSAQRKLVLRQLVAEQGLLMPDEKILEQIERDVLPAAADASPLVSWSGAECRRYRDALYLLQPVSVIPEGWEQAWQGEDISLPDGTLLHAGQWSWPGRQAQVRYRRGGETIRLAGHVHHRELKALMQEAGIPPWERGRLPLVFADGELVWVVGHWRSA